MLMVESLLMQTVVQRAMRIGASLASALSDEMEIRAPSAKANWA